MGTGLRLCGLVPLIALVAACDMGAERPGRPSPIAARPEALARERLTPDGALDLARSLRASGASRQALSVLASANARFPRHAEILSAYGRIAAETGQDELAASLLVQALEVNPDDWRALSAQGVVDGRHGRQTQAQRAFREANALAGANLASLNNLGVSYLLDGRAAEAAALFRQGLTAPGSDQRHAAQIRRNLAVAIAVDGDFELAERLAGQPLPRNLKHAGPEIIAAFMGIDRDASSEGSDWRARLADASGSALRSSR